MPCQVARMTKWEPSFSRAGSRNKGVGEQGPATEQKAQPATHESTAPCDRKASNVSSRPWHAHRRRSGFREGHKRSRGKPGRGRIQCELGGGGSSNYPSLKSSKSSPITPHLDRRSMTKRHGGIMVVRWRGFSSFLGVALSKS